MPLLTWRDPLPWRPSRVLVTGTSGAGKTSFAALIAQTCHLPRVELDALHHGENWVPRPEFAQEVAEFAAQPRWVTEWQYNAQLGDTLRGRADLVVWLDHPRHLVMRQVITRTVTRRLRRQILWNGNVEPPLRTVFTDPDHIIRWEKRGSEIMVVRLRGWRQASHWARRVLPELVEPAQDPA
jgi:adenylate kinase family enzyme